MKYTVLQGECERRLRELPYKSIDIVITSPPYNIGVDYGETYDDSKEEDRYLAEMWMVFGKIWDVLKDDGSFFLNIGAKVSNKELEVKLLSQAIEHFHIQNHLVWVKSIALNGDALGHYKPVNSLRYLNNCHEAVYHLTKTKNVTLDRLALGVPYKDKSSVARYGGGKDLRCRGNTWFIPYETVQAGKKHPAAFPLKLPEYCIKLHGYTEDTVVLDPYVGSGTTLHACKNLGIKRALGIEINPEYVELIKSGLEVEVIV